MAVTEIPSIVLGGVRRQVETVTQFLTEPVGVFETLDRIVRNTRRTVREVMESIKLPTPAILRR
jgi:hypothetical protein